MKRKLNLESLTYAAVIVLSVVALTLAALAATQFADTKLVYQGF